MDTGSFIVYIKIEGIYADIAKCVEAIFDTTNYELDRPLPKGKKRIWFNERWTRWKSNERIDTQNI